MIETDKVIYTVGHSSLSYESFRGLLRKYGVTAVADVRSMPFSRFNPQYNREALRDELKTDGFSYVFLGDELGGRPKDRSSYRNGTADYEKMAERPEFRAGLDRVVEGAKQFNIALMCSEHDPLDCHRCLLVARELKRRGLEVSHILHDGSKKSQDEIEQKLIALDGDNPSQSDLLTPYEDRLALAYRKRAERVAFSDSAMQQPNKHAAAE